MCKVGGGGALPIPKLDCCVETEHMVRNHALHFEYKSNQLPLSSADRICCYYCGGKGRGRALSTSEVKCAYL